MARESAASNSCFVVSLVPLLYVIWITWTVYFRYWKRQWYECWNNYRFVSALRNLFLNITYQPTTNLCPCLNSIAVVPRANLLWSVPSGIRMGVKRYFHLFWICYITLRWRNNGSNGVSNHQPHDCLFNCLYRRRSKKTSKLRVTGLCAGNSPVPGEFPTQMASNAETVSVSWRHDEIVKIKLPVKKIQENPKLPWGSLESRL